MEILTPKATRRSTRIRVEIPVSVISLDRQRPFGDRCLVVVVSAQGCGFRASEELLAGTPIMISDLPGGGSVTARVANCVPMGNDGKYFLVGASLYTHGNVWGIANAPPDWALAAKEDPAATPAASAPTAHESAPARLPARKKAWPYNVFSEGAEALLNQNQRTTQHRCSFVTSGTREALRYLAKICPKSQSHHRQFSQTTKSIWYSARFA